MKQDVFLSHATEDKPIINKLHKKLIDRKVSCWIDSENITIGDSILDKMNDGLRCSKFGIVLLTQNFLRSDKIWTKREFECIANRGRLLPVLYGMDHETANDLMPATSGICSHKLPDDSDAELDRLADMIAAKVAKSKRSSKPKRKATQPIKSPRSLRIISVIEKHLNSSNAASQYCTKLNIQSSCQINGGPLSIAEIQEIESHFRSSGKTAKVTSDRWNAHYEVTV